MKDEILYISETFKQADLFLDTIAEKLNSIGINFELNREKLYIETEKYKIIALPINCTCLGRSKSMVKYFVDASGLDEYKFNYIFYFPEHTKELKSNDEIIEIVRC